MGTQLDALHKKIEEMDEVETNSPANDEEVRPDALSASESVEDEVAVVEEVVEEKKVVTLPETETEEVVEAAADTVDDETVETPEEGAAPETPYTANLKYKAMKEEYELPDYLNSVIDSPEKEEEIKKIYSKAKGMEHFATKNESLSQQLSSVTPVMQQVQTFNKMLDDKNYHSALKLTGMADDDILRVASDIINVRELTPDQQAAYNTNIQSNQRLHQLEVENQRLQQQFTHTNESTQVNELESLIVQDDTVNISSAYDQRQGKAGAFRDAVISHAAMIEHQTMKNPNGPTILSPKDAVASYMNVMGFQNTPTEHQQVGDAGNTTQTVQNPRVIVKQNKPTIPNIRSGSKNPVKAKVRSLADLHKLAEGLEDY